jgi:hypothetical protein
MFLITLAVATFATAFGYIQARGFTRRRLRFVDTAQGSGAPWIAGVLAGAVALPVVGFLPLVGFGTAALFGAGVGTGVAAGVRDIRAHRYLP